MSARRVGEPLALGGRILASTLEDAERKADQVSIELDNFNLSRFERAELMEDATLEVSGATLATWRLRAAWS